MKTQSNFSILIMVVWLCINTVSIAWAQTTDCGNGLAQRLKVGDQAKVIPEPPRAVNVRQSPDGAKAGQIQSGDVFKITDGPQCASSYSWWQIDSDSGVRGWIVEGTDRYFVEPLRASSTDQPVSDNATGKDNTLFTDDFTSNQYDWETVKRQDIDAGVANGKYIIHFNTAHKSGYWLAAPGFKNWSKAPILSSPFEFDFEVSNLRSTSQSLAVAVLFDVGTNYNPYKRLLIGNGFWALYRWTGERELLGNDFIGLEDSGIDLLDEKTHKISLRVELNRYTLLIDEKVIVTVPSVDPIFGTVGIGLDAGAPYTEASGEFDNITVKPLENVSLGVQNQPLVNEKPNCNDVAQSQLHIGQQVKLTTPSDQVEWYYGHPLVDKGFFSLSALVKSYFDPRNTEITLSDTKRFEDSEMLLVEGPICFNEQYFWKVANPNESRSYGKGQPSDILPPTLSNLSFWVAEAVGNQYQLSLSATQPLVGPSNYVPVSAVLRQSDSAPILSADAQLAFMTPGNAYGRPFYWQIQSDCTVAETMDKVFPYEERCMYLYPVPPDTEVTVTLRRPDGNIFSNQQITPEKIQIEAAKTDKETTNFTIEGVRVDLPSNLGLQTGIWIAEAKVGNLTLSRAYRLRQQTEAPETGFWPYCDGPKPILVLTDYQPGRHMQLVLAEGRIGHETNEQGMTAGNFKEAYRWNITPGEHGELVLYTDFIPPVGYFLIPDENGDWRSHLDGGLAVWNKILSIQNQITYWPCKTYYSQDDAARHPISYGDHVSGSITANNQNYYAFMGKRGDYVTINVVDTNNFDPGYFENTDPLMDPKVSLRDSDGKQLAENDNARDPQYGPKDSEIRDFVLPEDSSYTIVVEYVKNPGTYALTLEGHS